MQVPAAYRPGLERARKLNSELADRYVQHAGMGDPLADAAVASLAGYGDGAIHRLLDAGMEQDEARFAEAPDALREFFERTSAPPPWLDRGALNAGCGAFQADPDLFILGLLAGGLVRGFSTLISLSFFTTGRLIDHAVRRLKHNIPATGRGHLSGRPRAAGGRLEVHRADPLRARAGATADSRIG